jgi:hypothetical protein
LGKNCIEAMDQSRTLIDIICTTFLCGCFLFKQPGYLWDAQCFLNLVNKSFHILAVNVAKPENDDKDDCKQEVHKAGPSVAAREVSVDDRSVCEEDKEGDTTNHHCECYASYFKESFLHGLEVPKLQTFHFQVFDKMRKNSSIFSFLRRISTAAFLHLYKTG